jgi:hypothetical protein
MGLKQCGTDIRLRRQIADNRLPIMLQKKVFARDVGAALTVADVSRLSRS